MRTDIWVLIKVTYIAIAYAILQGEMVEWGHNSPLELTYLDWWEHTIIYQIYPRSFRDTNGDGIGDLKGITIPLKHFVEMGVGAIWLSPIFSSPMVDFGYDISNFYEIHHEYGTMRDFNELVKEAHALGIKVILDFVPNHASTESEYFKRSVAREPGYENYFIWANPEIDADNHRRVPSNWISVFGGSMWEWNELRQQYYLHQFAKEQADFNFRELAVRQEMLNILRFWMERGVGGFRLDAMPHLFEVDPEEFDGKYPDEPPAIHQYGYNTPDYMRNLLENYELVYEWREFVDKWREDNNRDTIVLVAEAYTNITMTMLYYGDKRGRIGAHFPFNFDFVVHLSAESNARKFMDVINHWLLNMPPGQVANWVFGNHDNKRISSRFRTNMIDGLNILILMLPGVAVTYQGEEIGMRDGYVSWEDTIDVSACNQGDPNNYLWFSRDPFRTPYQWNNSTCAGFSTNDKPWLPIAQDYVEINLQAQREAMRSHFKVYQSLAGLRKMAALSHGETHIQTLSEYTLALKRYLSKYDTYVLVFNVGQLSDTVDLSRIQYLTEPMFVYVSSVFSRKSTGDAIPLGNVTLCPGEALVIRAAPIQL